MPDFLRQRDILDPSKILFPVTIIGCGGIGSAVALTFAKMGVKKITLYDPDTVKPHNRPNQWFRQKDEGRFKVEAASEIIEDFAEWCKVTARADQFNVQRLEGVVVCAIDHMNETEQNPFWGRREIWEKAIRWNIWVPLYIDCRLGGEMVQVYTVRPCMLEDVEQYEGTLFSENEAAELPCAAQQIIYTGLEAAVLAASQFKKWLKKEPYSLKRYTTL